MVAVRKKRHSDEQGQALVIVAAFMGAALLFGLLLLINVAYLVNANLTLDRAFDAAAASGMTAWEDLPGGLGAASDAEATTELILSRNITSTSFVRSWSADVAAVDPAGGCATDPFDPEGACYTEPFVSTRGNVSIEMLWGQPMTLTVRTTSLEARKPQ